MKLEAAVIQGDGVGPEMMEEAVRVLQAVCRRFGHHLKLYPVLACSQAIEAGKEPLPQESLKSVPRFRLSYLEFRSEKIPGLAVG